ncbi:MAG: hypothetical protein C0183_11820 [Roseiflexus castenholzii]|uniref:hypothetical protein n=1 Tax=Roseiflexus castenholzii TaxID=120962 RepID=UPI000CB3C49F|nr:MAG: hypothetical protein C0183_11820 [Roseiflexus castenholzii]
MSDASSIDTGIYHATAIGILDFPPAHRQNPSRRPQLRVTGPLGGDFRLPIRVMREISGHELLDPARHGTRLLVEGRLEWHTSPDQTLPVPTLIADAVRPVTPDDEDGCDIRMCGEVTGPARIGRHPLRSGIALAHLTLRVQIPRTRTGSRTILTETVRVPVVIPLNHEGTPALLRPGNRVVIEGMLEQALLSRSGPEVEQKLADLEAVSNQRAAWVMTPEEARAVERDHARRRWQATHTIIHRVVAGYVELLKGAPATIREARELRRAAMQRRAQRQQPSS